MMHNRFYFADVFSVYVKQSGYTPGQLSRHSGIPKPTIVNWLEGRVRRPRSWRDLVKLAGVLHLDQSDATRLLQSAGHPPIKELLARAKASKKRAELELLSKWIITPNGNQQQSKRYLFDAMVQRRMQAEDWKLLHEDGQTISFKLFMVRGAISADHMAFALESLEMQWRMECSDLIKRFIRLEHLPDRRVREQFREANRRSRWLERLQQNTERLDYIVDQCAMPADLQVYMRDLSATLYRLERISNELLRFFDDKLLRTLRELEHDIEEARRHFL
ncbi:MAG: hypothetical protein ACPGWR_12010 [Ardenticatenaceae bacterium]